MTSLKELRIGVLMGGTSAEREISLRSGRAMALSLRRQDCDVVEFDVDAKIAAQIQEAKIGLAVIALHGRMGEDGAIQGLLEILGIPYTGSGVLASAIAMNKIVSKELFIGHDIPTPRYAVVGRAEARAGAPAGLSFPLVVKPPAEGSTMGLTIVREPKGLPRALEEAYRFDTVALVEEFVPGTDATVGIFDDKPLPVIEIRPKSGFYDYEAKYTKGKTEYIVPAPFSDTVTRETQKLARRAHLAIGCRGCTRVDFRITPEGRPLVLEINTIPGMTETSLLPKAAEAAGIGYDRLVGWIAQAALSARRT